MLRCSLSEQRNFTDGFMLACHRGDRIIKVTVLLVGCRFEFAQCHSAAFAPTPFLFSIHAAQLQEQKSKEENLMHRSKMTLKLPRYKSELLFEVRYSIPTMQILTCRPTCRRSP